MKTNLCPSTTVSVPRAAMECGPDPSGPLSRGGARLRRAKSKPHPNSARQSLAPPLRFATLATVLFAFILHNSSFIPRASAQYAIPWFKIAGGGGMQSTGGVYALSGTIGQVDTGRVAFTNAYRIEAGFWAIAIQQLGYPTLNITKDAGTNYFVSWLTAEPGLILQQAPVIATPTLWTDVSELVSTNGFTNLVQQALATGVSNRYYRLRRP